MSYPVVEHDQQEREYAKWCSDMIMESVRKYGKRSEDTWERQCELKHQGTAGEIAFFKYINFPYRLFITKGGDDGDIKLNGKVFDIKTSDKYCINVNIRAWGKFAGYIGVRCNEDLSSFEILGAIDQKKAEQVATYYDNGIDRWGRRDGYYHIEAADLYNIDNFMGWIKKYGNKIEYIYDDR